MYCIMTKNGWRPWLPLNAPAPNSNHLEGVYRPEPIEKVRSTLSERMSRFLAANSIQNGIEKQQHFRGDSFREPLYGSFGEKL